jgi:D-lactate dehydrogenase (cytochrome)
VSNLLKSGLEPRCVELLDTTCMAAVNTNLPPSIPEFQPKPHIFFKLAGSSSIIPQQQKSLVSILKSSGGTDLRVAKTVGEGETLWEIRKNLVYSLLSMLPGSAVIGTDACVPVSRLPGLIEQYKVDQEVINREIEKEAGEGNESLKGRKLASLILGHVGDGNFHSLMYPNRMYLVCFLTGSAYEKGNEEMKKKAQQLESSLVMNAIAMDGTCSGEHGVGIHKIVLPPIEKR